MAPSNEQYLECLVENNLLDNIPWNEVLLKGRSEEGVEEMLRRDTDYTNHVQRGNSYCKPYDPVRPGQVFEVKATGSG